METMGEALRSLNMAPKVLASQDAQCDVRYSPGYRAESKADGRKYPDKQINTTGEKNSQFMECRGYLEEHNGAFFSIYGQVEELSSIISKYETVK